MVDHDNGMSIKMATKKHRGSAYYCTVKFRANVKTNITDVG